MKFNLKAIAAAVALVATGSANAAFQDALTAGGSSLVVVAFNAVTNAYYVRDNQWARFEIASTSITGTNWTNSTNNVVLPTDAPATDPPFALNVAASANEKLRKLTLPPPAP